MRRSARILPDIAGAFTFIVFVAFVLFAGKRALGDGDTLWHIKFGSLILERGELITRDFYSHTAAGKPWTSHEWLAEVVMAAIHRLAGLPGVVIFYFLLAALSFWLLLLIARRCGAGEWLSIFAVGLSLPLCMSHLLARPHIFTWLLGLFTLLLLLRGGRYLLLLPLLMVPWVNLHGGFALGLVLQGVFIAGRVLDQVLVTPPRPRWRELWHEQRLPMLVLLLSVLATGVNPFGYKLLLFPFEVSKGSFSQLISEWIAPSLQAFWDFRLYLLFLFLLLCISGPKVNWTNRLLLLFLVNASLTHARHISIAGLFLTPLVVQAGRAALDQFPHRQRRKPVKDDLLLSPVTGPVATVAAGIILIWLSAIHWQPWERLANVAIPLPKKFSSEVVVYLEKTPPSGNLFNHDEWGDYLIYAMDTPPKLFLDGRLDMYGEEVLEDYAKIIAPDAELEGLFEKYEIEWVLFPPSPLTRLLLAKGNWEETYGDDQISVLVRKEPTRP